MVGCRTAVQQREETKGGELMEKAEEKRQKHTERSERKLEREDTSPACEGNDRPCPVRARGTSSADSQVPSASAASSSSSSSSSSAENLARTGRGERGPGGGAAEGWGVEARDTTFLSPRFQSGVIVMCDLVAPLRPVAYKVFLSLIWMRMLRIWNGRGTVNSNRHATPNKTGIRYAVSVRSASFPPTPSSLLLLLVLLLPNDIRMTDRSTRDGANARPRATDNLAAQRHALIPALSLYRPELYGGGGDYLCR
ncbi:hypothetical protein L249_6458, partial [Ophiocordyceps polyrhachis-furcata BCC 54312]